MTFPYNSTGVNMEGQRPILPNGKYSFVILDATEKTSKKAGYPMAELDIRVIDNPDYGTHEMKHWVVFMPVGEKGDFINVHFRKCIGVPYDGECTVDPTKWKGLKFEALVSTETQPYTAKDGTQKIVTRNKIEQVYPYGGKFPEIVPDSECPF